MKNKLIGLALLVGVVAISSCVTKKYKYLSTDNIATSFPNALANSGSGVLYNVQYQWDATSHILTINCSSGYGYVTRTYNDANDSRDTNLVAINSNGDVYDTLDINLYPSGGPPVATLDSAKNGYFVDLESDTEAGFDFTCVPLSTDSQWAGN